MRTFLNDAKAYLNKAWHIVLPKVKHAPTRSVATIVFCCVMCCALTGVSPQTGYATYENRVFKQADDLAATMQVTAEPKQLVFTKLSSPAMVRVDGQTQQIDAYGTTVREVLAQAGVIYTDTDIITPGLDEPVCEDVAINIQRVEYREYETIEHIPFDTITQSCDTLYKGKTEISVPGQKGKIVTVTREKIVDGTIVDSKVVSQTTTEPVTQVTLVGTKTPPGYATIDNPISTLTVPAGFELDENGVPKNYKQKLTGKAVAYSTKRATKLRPGCVAVDYRKIPKGTTLYITTPDNSFVYGYSRAADTGAFATMPGNTVLVDLFFSSYEETIKFGAKKMDVYILE